MPISPACVGGRLLSHLTIVVTCFGRQHVVNIDARKRHGFDFGGHCVRVPFTLPLSRSVVIGLSHPRSRLRTDTPVSPGEDCNLAVNRSSRALTLMTPINRFSMRELRSADVTEAN